MSKNNKITAVSFFLVIGLLSAIYIYYSDWFYFIDEPAHFLYSRFAIETLQAITEPWHKLGRVFLFAIPAQFGHVGVKIFGAGLLSVMLYYVYKIAILLKIEHKEFVILFVGLQPLLFDVSFTCLAELPVALLITFSYYSYLKNNYSISIAVSSLIFLFRTEMFYFSILMAVVIILKTKNYKYALWVIIGPFIWQLVSYIFTHDITKLYFDFIRFSHLGKYNEGVDWYHYFKHTPDIFGILQTIFFIIGMILIIQSKKIKENSIIIITIILAFLINTFSASKSYHFSGSVGDLRYLVPISAFFGIISMKGLSCVIDQIKFKKIKYSLLIVVSLFLLFNCIKMVQPHRINEYYGNIKLLLDRINKEDQKSIIMGNCFVIPYILDEPPSGGARYKTLTQDNLVKYDLFKYYVLWDPMFSNSNFTQKSLNLDDFLKDKKYKILDSLSSREGKSYLLVKQKEF